MKVLDTRVYQGPNLYASFRVIRMTVDLGPLESWPSARIDGFVDGLVAAIPSIAEHGCSYREPGGFIRRLREDGGTWLGHVFEHLALELQSLAGTPVSFGKTRTAGKPGHYDVVFEYEEARVGEEAAGLALRLLRQPPGGESLGPGVGEAGAVDGLAARAGAVGEVATLDHEADFFF